MIIDSPQPDSIVSYDEAGVRFFVFQPGTGLFGTGQKRAIGEI
ncbi:MAG: hypothetical protein ACNA8K_01395 [Cyclonatronaceae bacterium]